MNIDSLLDLQGDIFAVSADGARVSGLVRDLSGEDSFVFEPVGILDVPPGRMVKITDGHDSVLARLERSAGATLHLAEDIWSGSIHALTHPGDALDVATLSTETVEELVRTTLAPADPPTRLNRELCGVKHVAWAEPIPLADVKGVSKALGCTINDVLVSCATGALRGYLVAEGDAVDGLEFRAEVPVNIRPPEYYKGEVPYALGFVDLPEGIKVETLFTQCDFDELAVDLEVEMILDTLHIDEEGNEVICYKFRPVRA